MCWYNIHRKLSPSHNDKASLVQVIGLDLKHPPVFHDSESDGNNCFLQNDVDNFVFRLAISLSGAIFYYEVHAVPTVLYQ